MRDKQLIKLIKLLSNNSSPKKSQEICKELEISPRTFRNYVKKYRSVLNDIGILLNSKPGIGYWFEIIDYEKYSDFVQNGIKHEVEEQLIIPTYPEERVTFLIKLFLSNTSYLTIADLEEQLFVSQSTLTNDLREVRNKLKHYNLEIENRPNYGMKIKGKEFDLRSCISKYYFYTDIYDNLLLQNEEDLEKKVINNLLYETITEKNFPLTDIGFKNLVNHLMIVLLRNGKVKVDKKTVEKYRELEEMEEFEISTVLVKKIEDTFNTNLSDLESYYITLHLLGKQLGVDRKNNNSLNRETDELLEAILKEIHKMFGIDFSLDTKLVSQLATHFLPMMNRLKYGLYIDNPITELIRDEDPFAFEIALFAANIVRDKFGYQVNLDEIGYLAPHFSLAIHKSREHIQKKNILVVCASGAGSSQILLYKLKQKYSDYLNEIKIIRLYEISKIDQQQYDLVISTVPITEKLEIPIIRVQYFLNDKDLQLIDVELRDSHGSFDYIEEYFKHELLFTDIKSSNSEGIIREMCTRIGETISLPESFFDLVIQREELAPTEFGNKVALPHPIYPISKNSFVAFAVLQKPIKWKKEMVKYVFLLSPGAQDLETLNRFNIALAAVVTNKYALSMLDNAKDVSAVHDAFRHVCEIEQIDKKESIWN